MSKNKKYVCEECEVVFTIKIVEHLGSSSDKKIVEICPFCGDVADTWNTTPLLKDFDDYDNFEDDYYTDDED
jgi:ssDNA-binding Zn-finger/Zn-ribbon topoisomerase 1